MKNLRPSITFCDCIVKLCLATLSTLLSSWNLDFVYLSSDILYSIIDTFSIYLSMLQYDKFLIMSFINGLEINLLILGFIVSNLA